MTALTLRWSDTDTHSHTHLHTGSFTMMFHCNAGEARWRNKVFSESSPSVLPAQVMAEFQSGASIRALCLNILCVFSEPGEAASLCDRQRSVFDPGYLASSTLSQPLEPSQGNWLTVWSPSDSTTGTRRWHTHEHTNTFVTCERLLTDGARSCIHSLTHVRANPLYPSPQKRRTIQQKHAHTRAHTDTDTDTHRDIHTHSCYHLCAVR